MTPIILKKPNQRNVNIQLSKLKEYTNHKFECGDKIIIGDNAYFYRRIKKKAKVARFMNEEEFFKEKSQTSNRLRKIRAANQEGNPYVNEIENYKLNKGCENPDCKCTEFEDSCQLDFDHKDPKTKEHSISDLVHNIKKSSKKETQEKYFETAKAEIKKCRVLCRNCHGLKTKEEKCGAEKISEANTKDKSYYIHRPPIFILPAR